MSEGVWVHFQFDNNRYIIGNIILKQSGRVIIWRVKKQQPIMEEH